MEHLSEDVDALLDALLEERRSGRVAVDVECQCVSADFVLLGDRIVNLSPDGVLLRTLEPAAIGDVVVLSFRLPGSAQWIDAEARVVRLVTGTRPGAPGLGLELLDLGPFERELLAGSLGRLRARAARAKRPRISAPRTRGDTVARRPIVRVR